MEHVEVRRYRRVNLGPGYLIQFRARERFFMGLQLTSLGVGGCSVKLSSMLASSLRPEDVLTRIYLQNLETPRHPMEGKISWIRGRQPGQQDDSVTMGIEFTVQDEAMAAALDACVERILESPA
jgi:hypothetical protein